MFRTILPIKTQTNVSQYQCCWTVQLFFSILGNSRSSYLNMHFLVFVAHWKNLYFSVVWVWMLNQSDTQPLWVPASLAGGEIFECRLPVCKETTSAQCPVCPTRCPAESSKCQGGNPANTLLPCANWAFTNPVANRQFSCLYHHWNKDALGRRYALTCENCQTSEISLIKQGSITDMR